MREPLHLDTAPPPPGAPRALSIFTLRPSARTERPAQSSPPRPKRRRFVALGLAAGLLVAGVGAAVPGGRAAKGQVVYVSGVPETKQTADGRDVRWWRGEVTISIDASVDQLGPGAREAVQMAFGAWLGSGAKLPALRFEDGAGAAVGLKPDGRNSVIFAPIELAGQKQSLAVTISHIDSGTGEIVEADLVINAKKPFGLLDAAGAGDGPGHGSEQASCASRYDLQNVVTHEVGHFFGLDEDEVDPGATMFFKTGKCELGKRDLSEPDTAVVTGLYSAPVDSDRPESSGCRLALGQASGRGNGNRGTWAMVGSLLAFWLFRRASRTSAVGSREA